MQAALEVRGLSRSFKNLKAVDDVSFAVYPGQVVGFIGPNGAGKTTTMRIAASLDTPTHGDVFVAGISVVEYPDRARLRLGYMPDAFGTYPYTSVWEYLDFFARAYGLRGAPRRRQLSEIMAFTDLESLADRGITELSKGMKQRLGLARAMVNNPEVLILDEPAAGLDPRARVELRELVKELAARGKAVLISSHILTELAEMCNAVAIIERGRIVRSGTLDALRGEMTPARVLLVRVLGPMEAAERAAAQAPGVLGTVRRDPLLEVRVEPSDETAARVLRSLLDAGIQVVEFRASEENLEHLFLRLTRGSVQ